MRTIGAAKAVTLGALSLYVECRPLNAWCAFVPLREKRLNSSSTKISSRPSSVQEWLKGGFFFLFCFPVVHIWVCVRGLDSRIYLCHIIIISFWILVLCEYLFYFSLNVFLLRHCSIAGIIRAISSLSHCHVAKKIVLSHIFWGFRRTDWTSQDHFLTFV